jgi:glycosyltransferase involved in cell wall biosynthesis
MADDVPHDSSAGPTVSVVIPTYNSPDLLLETIASVQAQTFGDFEIVVIDDGSTDDTPQRLAELATTEPRLRVVRQQNAGIGAARNRGIDEARGHYVAVLDHDDLWEPEKLETQVRWMQEHPEAVAVSTPWDRTNDPGRHVFPLEVCCEPDGTVKRPLLHFALGRCLIITASLLFDREKAAGLRYATVPKAMEDVSFQIGLLLRGPFGVAGRDILTHYRIHPGNYSKQAVFFDNGIKLLREMDEQGEFAEAQGVHREDLDDFLAMLGRLAAVHLATAGYRSRALSLYKREWPHQRRLKRTKFLATYPLVLLLPTALVRRKWQAGSEA